MANKTFDHAKRAKNDEFFTQKWDVEQELSRYHDSLTGKAILCNCDDANSAFFHYFYRQFGFLQLKQLICVNYNMDGSPSYALLYKGGSDSDLEYKQGLTKIPLKDNGDFQSDECVEFLKQSDVVVTNPPFSLAREFIKQLADYHKEFLIIGNKNWITYKEMFPLLMQRKVWIGAGQPKEFDTPDGKTKKVAGLTRWFTTLPVKKSTDQVVVFEHFDFVPHPVYDNYPAFECSKVEDIPADLEVETDIDSNNLQGWIKQYKSDIKVLSDNGTVAHIKVKRPIYGVPITFMDKYNPSSIIDNHNLGKEFDILGLSKGATWNSINHINVIKHYNNAKQVKKDKLINGSKINTSVGIINKNATEPYYIADNAKGKIITKYARIFIRVKPGVTKF